MKRTIIALLYLLPSLAFSAPDTPQLKERQVVISAELVRSCSVTVGGKLNLGSHRSNWNGVALDGVEAKSMEIKLEDCDRGTVIKITAEGLYKSIAENEYYLGNSSQGNSDIFALLWLYFPGDASEKYLNFSRKVPYTYTASIAGTHTLTLNGALRRVDLNQSPVGKFSSPLTLTFDFQ